MVAGLQACRPTTSLDQRAPPNSAMPAQYHLVQNRVQEPHTATVIDWSCTADMMSIHGVSASTAHHTRNQTQMRNSTKQSRSSIHTCARKSSTTSSITDSSGGRETLCQRQSGRRTGAAALEELAEWYCTGSRIDRRSVTCQA